MEVVVDQIGSPTSSDTLAEVIFELLRRDDVRHGLYHFCNEGVASWYDVACAVERMIGCGEEESVVHPCLSSDFESGIVRPKYSVLSTRKLYSHFPYLLEYRVHWQDALSDVVQDVVMSEENE